MKFQELIFMKIVIILVKNVLKVDFLMMNKIVMNVKKDIF